MLSASVFAKLQPAATGSPPAPDRRLTAWLCLTVWLLYSASALGWNLAHDPQLLNHMCRSR